MSPWVYYWAGGALATLAASADGLQPAFAWLAFFLLVRAVIAAIVLIGPPL